MKNNILAAASLAAGAMMVSAPALAAVTVTDRISNNGTDDIFFNFSGGAFSVEVDPAANNGLSDPEIFLFRDNGSVSGNLTGARIDHNDAISATNLSSLISRTLAAGSYVLSIGSFNFTESEARSGMADFTPMERRFVATFSDGVTVTAGLAAVPEPASWAMMVAGFGAMGFALRRRNGRKVGVRFA